MSQDPPPRDPSALALVGYRGTGKSTVGRILAGRLGWAFRDSDSLLESTHRQPVSAIFQDRGEPAFRDLEAAVLDQLVDGLPRVVATGGGIVVRPENRQKLRRFGLVVWLTAEPDRIARRIGDKVQIRPALTSAGTLGEIAEVLALRTPWYREAADLEVATDDRSPGEVAEAILSIWRDRTC